MYGSYFEKSALYQPRACVYALPATNWRTASALAGMSWPVSEQCTLPRSLSDSDGCSFSSWASATSMVPVALSGVETDNYGAWRS